jgi:cellulose synthase/poly-beta-1,6-N-acetylglucosamine synthase-like glycosyltransferase/peptidoglycan/xylan/chitin deacetylase (PgdA/CDA1 family)/spore germination protein YaaH
LSSSSPNPPEKRFVFLDTAGHRWPVIRFVLLALLLAALVCIATFIRALCIPVDLHVPENVRAMKHQLKALAAKPSQSPHTQDWLKFPGAAAKLAAHHAINQARPVRLAFTVSWDAASFDSLAQHAADVTHVSPEWFSMVGTDSRIVEEPDAKTAAFALKSGIDLIPLLRNLDGDDWQPEAVESLANADAVTQAKFFDEMTHRLGKIGAQGVMVDWNELDPGYRDKYTALLGGFSDALHAKGMQLWLLVPAGEALKSYDLEALAAKTDRFVAALHDENSDQDEPGPIASMDWYEGWLNVFLRSSDPEKWVVVLGAYGYDWEKGKAGAETIGFADAMTRAARAGIDNCTASKPDYSPNFSYDQEGREHEVWFLDAVTLLNQMRAAADYGVTGFGIDRLGQEDPGIWPVLKDGTSETIPNSLLESLHLLSSSDQVATVGRGEFLTAADDRQDGVRDITVEEGKVSEVYKTFPTFPTLYLQGFGNGHEVALTFDDGPDPEWTPKVLDILKAKKVPGAFFLVGRNVEQYPGLLNRIIREGHELGNHTYTHGNLAEDSGRQIELELTANTRLIEAITGRSVTLFRPPYAADTHPESMDEFNALVSAGKLGYITACEDIDPEDWARPGADAIFQRVKEQRANGSIILLHDAGGDRSQTVEALPRIIDWLHARGDTVVPLRHLLGVKKDVVMPKIAPERDNFSSEASRLGLLVWQKTETALWAFLITATILLLLRTAVIAVAATIQKRREKKSGGDFVPPLSILIAAYNEEKVIASTLHTLLASEYPSPFEIIVIDDGSKDDTFGAAEAVKDARVRVVRQPNSGKAEALNHAMRLARNEFLVMLDADTQAQPDTLLQLVQPLSDPKVGAVSGRIHVGNQRTAMARFQALEYLSGFNLDRRAYDVMGCITVIPGALSAYRAEAVRQAGFLSTDTLAEDTDFTLTLHRLGWKCRYASEAAAWTEAPETASAFVGQRFRWAYGTLQCLWKHRDLTLNPRMGWLGLFALPGIWFFQIALVALTPLVDFLVLVSILFGNGLVVLAYFAAFLGVEAILCLYAVMLEGRGWKLLPQVAPMRVVYRPLLAYVIWKVLLRALRGRIVGWGKLERTASVDMAGRSATAKS